MIGQRLHHFGVGEFEQAGPLLDQNDAHAERREHAGVFDANHAAAHHHQGLGDLRHLQDLIAVQNGAPVDGDLRRDGGLGADRDDHIFRVAFGGAGQSGDAHGMGVDERGRAEQDIDAVAPKLGNGDVDLGADDMLHAERQIGHGDLVFHAVVDPV